MTAEPLRIDCVIIKKKKEVKIKKNIAEIFKIWNIEEIIMNNISSSLEKVLEKTGWTAKWESRGEAKGEARGEARGEGKGRTQVFELLEKGFSVEEAKKKLGM